MTVISTKSITGVTSITSPQSDDAVTLHTNDTTQRVSVTTGGMNVTGVVTATSFSGDVIGNITGAITATTGSFSGLRTHNFTTQWLKQYGGQFEGVFTTIQMM